MIINFQENIIIEINKIFLEEIKEIRREKEEDILQFFNQKLENIGRVNIFEIEDMTLFEDEECPITLWENSKPTKEWINLEEMNK